MSDTSKCAKVMLLDSKDYKLDPHDPHLYVYVRKLKVAWILCLGTYFIVHTPPGAVTKRHFTHEIEGPWPLHSNISHWSKRSRPMLDRYCLLLLLYHSRYYNEDFALFDTGGVWVTLLSKWFRRVLTQRIMWVCQDSLTLTYPSNINIWLVQIFNTHLWIF